MSPGKGVDRSLGLMVLKCGGGGVFEEMHLRSFRGPEEATSQN